MTWLSALTVAYLQMPSKSVEVEEFAGLVAIAARLHLTTEQDVTTQQAHLCSHIHPIHLLSHVDELRLTCACAHTRAHTVITTRREE